MTPFSTAYINVVFEAQRFTRAWNELQRVKEMGFWQLWRDFRGRDYPGLAIAKARLECEMAIYKVLLRQSNKKESP